MSLCPFNNQIYGNSKLNIMSHLEADQRKEVATQRTLPIGISWCSAGLRSGLRLFNSLASAAVRRARWFEEGDQVSWIVVLLNCTTRGWGLEFWWQCCVCGAGFIGLQKIKKLTVKNSCFTRLDVLWRTKCFFCCMEVFHNEVKKWQFLANTMLAVIINIFRLKNSVVEPEPELFAFAEPEFHSGSGSGFGSGSKIKWTTKA